MVSGILTFPLQDPLDGTRQADSVLSRLCVLLSGCGSPPDPAVCSGCHTGPPVCRAALPALGLLLVGDYDKAGAGAEVWVPGVGSCNLPALPRPRAFHSLAGLLVCGGLYSAQSRSCLALSPAGW